jgi:two-component system response regulator NreC
MSIRILVADDHRLIRRGLRDLVEEEPNMEIVGEASDTDETIRLARELRPDIVLLDISMPSIGGIETTRRLRAMAAELRVLILTVHEDESLLREALHAGAMGYIVKRAADSELIDALRAVARGHHYVHPSVTRALLEGLAAQRTADPEPVEPLTPRELDVLRLLAQGYTNRQIATQLSISVRTVEGHRANLMSKLGLESRLDLVNYARRQGLI